MIYSCKPSRVGIYLNTYPYKSMAQIKQETGCDIICNGQMFNSDWSPTHNMRADGKTLAYEANYLGYGWNKDDTVLTMTRDYAAFDNFLSCVALIDKGTPLPLRAGVDYPAALGGTRGRTAIGITADGRLVLFCSSDGSSAAKTMKEIQQSMMERGCVTALNLDGGASCSCITPTGTIETSRTIHNYVCIWTDDPDAKEEKPLFKIALGAGHGLTTPGKRCDKTLDPKETPEWWLNDRICDMVESYLKDYEGYEILRLDDSDDGADDIALASRVSHANAWDADVYVSVHHNAGANRTNAGGICAFSYPNSTKGAQWRDEELVEGVSVRWLIEHGRLAPYEYYAPTVVETEGLRIQAGDYVIKDLEELMNERAIYGDVIESYKRFAPGERSIVYCVSVKHARETADAFNSAGIRAEFLSAGTVAGRRVEIMEAFRRGEFTVLCNVGIISEGVSIDEVSCCMLLRPTESLALFWQQGMRCMRYQPDKVAKIIDFVGNYTRNPLFDADVEWDLTQSIQKRPAMNSEGDFQIRSCPKCFKVFKTAKTCPYCGHTYPFFDNDNGFVEVAEYRNGEVVSIGELRPNWLKNLQNFLYGEKR